MIVGPKKFIEKTRWFRKAFGGGVRQSGPDERQRVRTAARDTQRDRHDAVERSRERGERTALARREPPSDDRRGGLDSGCRHVVLDRPQRVVLRDEAVVDDRPGETQDPGAPVVQHAIRLGEGFARRERRACSPRGRPCPPSRERRFPRSSQDAIRGAAEAPPRIPRPSAGRRAGRTRRWRTGSCGSGRRPSAVPGRRRRRTGGSPSR